MRNTAFVSLLFGAGVTGLNLTWNIDSNIGNSIAAIDVRVFQDSDPTGGFVKYVDQGTASSGGLFSTNNSQIYLGADHTNTVSVSGPGRNSVRVTSKNTFNNGILIADFAHLPTAACGIWPAYWTINNDGNPYGEIDIIESYDDTGSSYVSLHTSNACTLTGTNFTGTNVRTDCSLSGNSGCGVEGTTSQFGAGFNSVGGGLYVLYLDGWLKVWVFPKNNVPSDITNGSPDPSGWGVPLFDFESNNGCDVGTNFINQSIIFNLDFCGSGGAGGQEWSQWTDCSTSTGLSTCEAYVAANPGAYVDTYFLINSIRLYQ